MPHQAAPRHAGGARITPVHVAGVGQPPFERARVAHDEQEKAENASSPEDNGVLDEEDDDLARSQDQLAYEGLNVAISYTFLLT